MHKSKSSYKLCKSILSKKLGNMIIRKEYLIYFAYVHSESVNPDSLVVTLTRTMGPHTKSHWKVLPEYISPIYRFVLSSFKNSNSISLPLRENPLIYYYDGEEEHTKAFCATTLHCRFFVGKYENFTSFYDEQQYAFLK